MTTPTSSLSSTTQGYWADQPESLHTVVDFRAGSLVTIDEVGAQRFGSLDAFTSVEGYCGATLMGRILRPPAAPALRHGALREALAMIGEAARYGHQETRSWETSTTYIVDNHEGDLGYVDFGCGCVAVVAVKDPFRAYDVRAALASMPSTLSDVATRIVEFPFFASSPITAVFWTSSEGPLGGVEPWYELYTYGAELFRRELLSDSDWMQVMCEEHDMPQQEAELVVRFVEEIETGRLTRSEPLRHLLGHDPAHAADAREVLESFVSAVL